MIVSVEKLKNRKIEINLAGPEGNAYVLLGYAQGFCKDLKLDWDKVHAEMTSGDYDNLVNVFDKYFGDYVILYKP